MTTDVEDLIARYFAAWNERDEVLRRTLVESVFTRDCKYVDTRDDVVGHAAIEILIQKLQARFPAFRFTLTRPIITHHQQVLFFWQLGAQDSPTSAATGADVALFAEGRICRLYGFKD